jgi:hypothetical protein
MANKSEVIVPEVVDEKRQLIEVIQLPEIYQQLHAVKAGIMNRVKQALALECTEETRALVKAERTAMNNEFKELEKRRIAIKKEIMTPYEQFEVVYKSCVTDIFTPATDELKAKIDRVEDGIKAEKESKVMDYFNELCTAKSIDFVKFEQTGAVVTLSVSLKKLKDTVKAFLDKVSDDLQMIDTQEHKAEILVEFKQSLNVSQAIMNVNNRHKAIDEERQRAEQARIERERQAAAVQNVDTVIIENQEHQQEHQALAAPVAVSAPFVEDETPTAEDTPDEWQSININILVSFPADKRPVFVELCKDFNKKLEQEGFRVGKQQ